MKLANDLFAVLGAPCCAGCGRAGGALCDACRGRVPRCGSRAPASGVRVVAPWEYDDAARALVLALKRRGRRACAGPLGDAVAAEARRAGVAATVLTWVPGGRDGVAARGFDHAREIALVAGRALGLPVAGLLERCGPRPRQAGLPAGARRVNPAGAFRARPCAGVVGLVDDVVTTGATAAACARALRAAGAARVEVLAACRAS
ncbi:MAG TPA: ComF family protein [Actinomycetota bacterium]|nr:ComF family protein [Actinomycetota bacterium]